MPSAKHVGLERYPARNIAIVKPSSLGDVVHCLPLVTGLRRKFPRSRIVWIVNRIYQDLLTGHPDLDLVIPFDRKAAGSWPGYALRYWNNFLREIRRQRFDLVLDLQGLFRSGFIAACTGARHRVGLSTAREGARWFYTDTVQVADAENIHAVDRYWLVARALGVPGGVCPARLPEFAVERLWVKWILRDFPRPWLALGVGSRWLTKRWPPGHFACLAQRALDQFGGTVLLVGGADEAELARQAAARIKGPVRMLAGQTGLRQLAAVLSLADVMLANDTGPMHLAVALGRPVVAPYTCTKAKLTGPYGQPRGAVESRVWCQGSRLKVCGRLDCMRELTPDRLWPRLQEILDQWQRTSLSA